MKNQGGKKQQNKKQKKANPKTKRKRDTILKLEYLDLMSYIPALTDLFLFSGVNNKSKSRDQW